MRRRALAERTYVEVAIAQFGDVAAASEDGLDVSVLARERHHRVEILAHAPESLEVSLDERLGFGVGNLELVRKCTRALAVGGREIDRRRASAHVRRDGVDAHIDHERPVLAGDGATRMALLYASRISLELRR